MCPVSRQISHHTEELLQADSRGSMCYASLLLRLQSLAVAIFPVWFEVPFFFSSKTFPPLSVFLGYSYSEAFPPMRGFFFFDALSSLGLSFERFKKPFVLDFKTVLDIVAPKPNGPPQSAPLGARRFAVYSSPLLCRRGFCRHHATGLLWCFSAPLAFFAT